MKQQTITRVFKDEGGRWVGREVSLRSVKEADLSLIVVWLQEHGLESNSQTVLECWRLCIDLLANLRGKTDQH